MQTAVVWLEQNNIHYSYVRDWKTTESLLPSSRKIIADLSQGSDKVQLEGKGKSFRVFAVYGAYPDPINPLFATNSVRRALLDEARNKRVDEIVNHMLSHTNITLYDRSFVDLRLPKFKGAVIEPKKSIPQRAYIACNCALMILAPCALYLFFEEKRPPRDEFEAPSMLDAIYNNRLFRAAVLLIAGVVIISPSINSLEAAFLTTTKENLIVTSVLGLTFGLVVAFAISKIELARNLFASGWVGLSVLFLIQMAIFLAIE